ncbi:PREDICTED: E3 ubiquitin-protein ligase TRIM39-like [Cyprinodon variegatus]|uniref:E3 ubiquitin-protein ligase TRIM39-like n=1 Tax=Cyprinodon variegatus TaxID=28743 RepID=A0A3Q2FMJ1_CYPVA|nr:PREDICTED: E3 ubiquitin-protein ligase TRIM39-like [Cyprinodon variegatus]
MSATSNSLSEDQFLCSICLDLFTGPVTTPCGHNFCKNCITQYWDVNESCNCPLCLKDFRARPEIQVNTLLSGMVAQFREEAQLKDIGSRSEQQAVKHGEVLCDVCTGTKLKALKSCLVCLLSYCQAHLEPHLTAPRLRRHQLMEPMENLEDRMCLQHDKPLELFCKTDQTCLCSLCSVLDHKDHEFVPLGEESEGKKAELRKTEDEVQKMIQNRRRKVQEIKESVKIGKEGVRVFTALKESAETGLKELIKEIEDEQKNTEKQAEGCIKDLEQEISELMKRSCEVKRISESNDHLHILQSFSSLNAAPNLKKRTEIRFCPPSYEGTVEGAVIQLEEELREKMKTFKLNKFQQHAVDVTLDPETAHPKLRLSADGKQVHCADVGQIGPENPKKFVNLLCVLGKSGFSSGRFSFEVLVKGKTHWMVGVSSETTDRKRIIMPSCQDGSWALSFSRSCEYEALSDPPLRLSPRTRPEKIGVFVDYEDGLVSFYDADAAVLIHSFTSCNFTGRIYPFFSPAVNYGGKNSAPLIICAVHHTKKKPALPVNA